MVAIVEVPDPGHPQQHFLWAQWDMVNNTYHQCLVIRKQDDTTESYVSWLPDKFAVLGKSLKLKFGSVWSDGWKVISASPAKSYDHLPDQHADGLSPRIKSERKG